MPEPLHPFKQKRFDKINAPDFLKLQDRDPIFRPIRQYLNGERTYSSFTPYIKRIYSNGTWKLSNNTGLLTFKSKKGGNVRICVPDICQVIVINQFHNKYIHLGVSKLLHYMKKKYYWVAMNETLDHVIKNCEVCQKGKITHKPHVATFQSIRPLEPNQVLGMDFVGPMPLQSEYGLTYVLTVVDYFDNYVKYIPCKSDSAWDVFMALVDNWFFSEGIPNQIVCDRGTHFTAALQRANATLFNYKINFTTPYNPHASGLAERYNRRFRSMMRIISLDQHRDKSTFEWWHFCSTASFINNICVSTKTGITPWSMRRCKPAMDVPHYLSNIDELLKEPTFKHSSYFKFMLCQRKLFKSLRIRARSNWNKYLSKRSLRYFSKLTKRQRTRLDRKNLVVGSHVMVKNVTKTGIVSDKLKAAYRGPYLVLGRTVGNNAYQLEDVETGKIDYVNFRHLKVITPASSRESPHKMLSQLTDRESADKELSQSSDNLDISKLPSRRSRIKTDKLELDDISSDNSNRAHE